MKNFFLIVIVFIMTSCVSRKEIVYFQNQDIELAKVQNNYKTIFKPDDLLRIIISSKDIEAVRPYNFNTESSSNENIGYLIDNEGYIDFPVIGKIKIAGLSKNEAIELIKNKLHPDHIKNPTVNIQILNFNITILGDVNSPGKYTIPNEKITVIEALGLAGDLKISGIRKIKIYRDLIDGKKEYELDLLSNNIFSSPAYYLQQNDVVYVEPNKASMQRAAQNNNTGLFLSLTSIAITLVTLLTR